MTHRLQRGVRFVALALGAASLAALIACEMPSSSAKRDDTDVLWNLVPGAGEDGALDEGGGAFYPQLAVFDGRLYNTWYEAVDRVLRIRVAVLQPSGGSPVWRFVDGVAATEAAAAGAGEPGLNRNPSRGARWSRLVVHDGSLYAYWHEDTDAERRTIRVARYNGNDASPVWSYIDGTLSDGLRHPGPDTSAEYATLASFDGSLYAAWRSYEGAPYQIRVSRFDERGAVPSWTPVDHGASGINRESTRDAYYPKLHVHDERLYAAWYERNGTARQLRVAAFSGVDASPRWLLVDGGGTYGLNYGAANGARGPQLLTHAGAMYAVWHERTPSGASQVRVARYNGDDATPAWRFVDGASERGLNRGSGTRAWWARAASLGDRLYVAWSENDAGAYRIRVSAGSDVSTAVPLWERAAPTSGLNRHASSPAEYPHLAAVGDRLYATWSERVDGVFRVFVRVLDRE